MNIKNSRDYSHNPADLLLIIFIYYKSNIK
jgi:hypothetical protein